MCRIHCPDGYARDERGCETCNCALPTVPVQEWKIEKENDFDPSSNFMSFYSRNVQAFLLMREVFEFIYEIFFLYFAQNIIDITDSLNLCTCFSVCNSNVPDPLP